MVGIRSVLLTFNLIKIKNSVSLAIFQTLHSYITHIYYI